MRTETVALYQFRELDDDAKTAALNNLRDINVDYPDWHESTTDDAKRMGAILGMDITDIYFSGFWSQGDGACFEGTYNYAKGAAKAIRAEAPQDKELHRIADELQALQRRYFYSLTASVKQRGRYSHEMCTDIRVYRETKYSLVGDVDAQIDESLTDSLRDFMRWIYRQLECEYEYLTSEEAVKQSIEANEYEFTANGEFH